MSTLIHTSAGYGGMFGDTKPTDKFTVQGTDLGFFFTGGKGAWVGGLFGDTNSKPDPYGPDPVGGNKWRSPVMGRSSNRDFLTKGVKWDNFAGTANTGGVAKQLFPYTRRPVDQVHFNDGTADGFTVIPNDIIQVPDGRYFAMGFRVHDWTPSPTQAMCHTISNCWFWSDEPNADAWQLGRFRKNLNRTYEWGSNEGRNRYFQNASFLMLPGDNHLYVFGSREGRKIGVGAEADGVYLRRARWDLAFENTDWEYWGNENGVWKWGKNVQPTAILRPLTPGEFIGDLTRRHIANKIVLTYADSGVGAVALTADRPDGIWSAPTMLVSRIQSAAQYAPSVHPWNTKLDDAYFHLSAWPQTGIPGIWQMSLAYCTQGWRGSLISDFGSSIPTGAKSLSLDTSEMTREDATAAITRVLDASAEANPGLKAPCADEPHDDETEDGDSGE